MSEISFFAVPGADYILEVSIDLQTWTYLNTVASYTGLIRYVDDIAADDVVRFYRVRQPSPAETR
jgi:hypothetical protein